MKIKTMAVIHDERTIKGPLLRVVVDGSGCDLPNCHCSPPNFITISDGETLLCAELTHEEAEDIKKIGWLDLHNDS